MKKSIAILIMCGLALASCSDEAVRPTDETTGKGHDDWKKVVFRFTEGEITDAAPDKPTFTGYAEDKTLTLKTVQEYTFTSTEDGLQTSKDTIKLIRGKAYALEVFYYNRRNELINAEFTTKEMAPLHQHFFIPSDIRVFKEPVPKGDKSDILRYHYRDTEPEDQMLGTPGVALRDKNDPIGLKGYFEVLRPYHFFQLRILLVHVIAGVKQADDGTAYPFYAPSPRVIGTTDLRVKMPLKVITDIDDADHLDEIAGEFGMDRERVREELSSRKLGKLRL